MLIFMARPEFCIKTGGSTKSASWKSLTLLLHQCLVLLPEGVDSINHLLDQLNLEIIRLENRQ